MGNIGYAITIGLLLCIHLYVVWKLAEIKDVFTAAASAPSQRVFFRMIDG
ncbi:MAG: hypothetical protein IJS89_03345 [Bacteroidaceae bacterium]|nr:hypothetical protein [Bacteroidaceae bacterium]